MTARAIARKLAAMLIAMARKAFRAQAQEGTVQITHRYNRSRQCAHMLRPMTLCALQIGVGAG